MHPTMVNLVLAAVSASSAAEKAAACGVPGEQSWLCSVAYDISGNQRTAEIADDFTTPLRIVLIIAIAFIVVRVSRLLIRRMVKRLSADTASDKIDTLRRRTGLAFLDTGPVPSVRRRLRAETIGAVLRSVVSVVVWATAILMVLGELGVNLAPLVAGAGILGVAIGFGSQALVRDFLSGIFMLVEDQYGVGDVIDAGEATGTVEGVSLRTTRLRDVEGTVWHIPNGEIRRVGNKSQQWSRAVLDVAITPDTDVAAATAVIRRVADEVANDREIGRVVLEEPEVWGVEEVGPDRILIRLVVKTKPLEQWRVARELRARIKRAFDAEGYAYPLPQQITVMPEMPEMPDVAGPSDRRRVGRLRGAPTPEAPTPEAPTPEK
ncbi:MAG: mechanosensitive ion channel family protein [Acidimicrobiia bacterium]